MTLKIHTTDKAVRNFEAAKPATKTRRANWLVLSASALAMILPVETAMAQNVAQGTITFLGDQCVDGQLSAADKSCITEVKYLGAPGLTLEQAKVRLAEDGLRLATREEIKMAWDAKLLDSYGYGMMADGKFAIPVQRDYPNFKKGVNFGATGGNQGLFYVKAPIAPPPVDPALANLSVNPIVPPPTPPGPLPVRSNNPWVTPVSTTIYGGQEGALSPQQFFVSQAADACADPGNFMVEGWGGPARGVLETAAKAHAVSTGQHNTAQITSALPRDLAANAELRWQFSPHMMNAAWDALVATNPTPTQTYFKQKFEMWAGCDSNLMARRNINRWNSAMNRSIDSSINGVSVEWINLDPSYKPNTLSVSIDTGPSIGSTGYDVTNGGNPMYIGQKGQEQLNKLFKPELVRVSDDADDLENLQLVRQAPFNFVYAGEIGFSGTLIASMVNVLGIEGGGKIWKSALNSSRAAKAKDALQAKRYSDLLRQKAQLTGQKAASSIADDVADNAVSIGFKAAAKKASQKLGAKVSTFLAPKFLVSAAGPILSGASFFASVFGEKLADIVKTNDYEAALIRDSRSYKPFDVKAMLTASPGDAGKAPVLSLLAKMLIAEPADRYGLTLKIPEVECPLGFSRVDSICGPTVRFFPGYTNLESMKKLAAANPAIVSDAFEVQAAWAADTLNVEAMGVIDDGRRAVPIQQNFGIFRKGANILPRGSGSPTGFFVTLAFVPKEFATAGNTSIQNGELLDQFLVHTSDRPQAKIAMAKDPLASWTVEKDGDSYRILMKNGAGAGSQLVAPSIKRTLLQMEPANMGSSPAALWNFEKVAGSFYRISSEAFKGRYIVIDSEGALQVNSIEPNDKRAIWHVPFVAGQSTFDPAVLSARASQLAVAPPAQLAAAYALPAPGATVAVTLAPSVQNTPTAPVTKDGFAPVPGFVRLQNNWYKDLYIHNEGQQLSLGEIKENWWSAMWKKVPTGGGYYLLQSRYRPTEYLHIQNGKLELGEIASQGWWSAQWKEIPVGGGWVQIQNRWKPDIHLNNTSGPTGKLEAIPVQPNWASSRWKVE